MNTEAGIVVLFSEKDEAYYRFHVGSLQERQGILKKLSGLMFVSFQPA